MAYRFSKENDIGLNITIASIFLAYRDFLRLNLLLDLIVWIMCTAFNAVLICEAAMGLYNLITRDACSAFQCIDVLREACV